MYIGALTFGGDQRRVAAIVIENCGACRLRRVTSTTNTNRHLGSQEPWVRPLARLKNQYRRERYDYEQEY
jgi:hypothetical protein